MKNKILTISIIFILLSFIFINNSVFAASYDLSDYKNIDLKNGSWVIFRALDDNEIYLLTTSDINYPYLSSDSYTSTFGGNWYACKQTPLVTSLSCPVLVYLFDKETSTFNYYKTGGIYADEHFNVYNVELIASGTDIYSHDGTMVFQKTPVPFKVFIQPLTIAEELEKVQATKTFQTMIRGIIPYLIALVIGLVAFWKAWQLLLKELRKV